MKKAIQVIAMLIAPLVSWSFCRCSDIPISIGELWTDGCCPENGAVMPTNDDKAISLVGDSLLRGLAPDCPAMEKTTTWSLPCETQASGATEECNERNNASVTQNER